MKKFNKKMGLFFKTIALFIWKISDFLAFLGALAAFVYGFFLLNKMAGFFALSFALIVLVLVIEWIDRKNGKDNDAT